MCVQLKKVLYLTFLITFLTFNSQIIANAQTKPAEKFIVNTITKDFVKTHHISFGNYNFVSYREISPNNNLTPSQKSLQNIVKNIAKEQMIGDWAPIIYINQENKKGYALEKKLSGMNKLHLLSYEDTSKQWKVAEDMDKMGTDLADLGLLKRAN